MTVVSFIFYFFIALAAAGAVGILFSSNVFKAALSLLVTLVAIAGIFAISFAEFLAVTQILIYAGGITVVLIFGIMLTTRMSGRPLVVNNKHIISGAMIGVGLLTLLCMYLHVLRRPGTIVPPGDISDFALQLFSVYSFPFELAGILLLVALIGAAVITSHLKSRT